MILLASSKNKVVAKIFKYAIPMIYTEYKYMKVIDGKTGEEIRDDGTITDKDLKIANKYLKLDKQK